MYCRAVSLPHRMEGAARALRPHRAAKRRPRRLKLEARGDKEHESIPMQRFLLQLRHTRCLQQLRLQRSCALRLRLWLWLRLWMRLRLQQRVHLRMQKEQ